jgi:hypothetical protein
VNRAIAGGLALVLTLAASAPVMAIEQPSYRVVESAPPFEIRDYAPHVVAETRVEGSFGDVGNEGFRRLFGYISGENRTASKIAMTAPVTQQAASEKIAMTAPVTQRADGGAYRIAFVLPSAYTLDTAPVPTHPAVRLAQVPARRMVAVRYSGAWSVGNYQEALARLAAFAEQRQLVLSGEPVYARYDPPFMPWFLRRNEILMEVAR